MSSNSAQSGRIFICYRRGRTSYPATLLYDRLSVEFGKEQIFKDVDNIRPGEDFVDKMRRAVSSCDVLLVLIGPDWLSVADERGRRLDDPSDFVRLEIETALARRILVIPLLVEDARMPRADELPESLQHLVRRQALELSAAHSSRDTEELVAVLRDALAVRAREQALATQVHPSLGPLSDLPQSRRPASVPWSPAGDQLPGVRRRRRWLLGAVLALVIAGLALAVPQLTPRVGGRSATSLPQSKQGLPDDELVWRQERGRVANISTIDTQGKKGLALTGDGLYSSAVLSRDRRTVLYLKTDASGARALHAVAADGQDDRLLFSDGSDACPSLRRPSLFRDQLAVVCLDRAGSKGALVLMSLDGAVVRRLDTGLLGDPTFTQDGASLVYWRNGSGGVGDGGALYRVGIEDGAKRVQLTSGGDGVDADPACSPDGTHVAFRHGVEGKRRIALLALGTSKPVRYLTSGRKNDQDPSWSPDGSQIAFRRGPDRNSDVYVMSSAGKAVRPILRNLGNDTGLVWTAR